ncbi:MAG TPA: serine/threonine-protein kinase [Terriglobia bacterium]|nr:serine/threonine-protein kinase [Terriglobia bacterium]
MEQLGRYEILEVLGHGAMGTVFRARDPKIDRIVAVKTITRLSASGEDEEYRQRFFREAHTAGKLSHPGVVTIYDVGEEESTGTPYIVMEYIQGRTLESLIREWSGAPPIQLALDLLEQVADALDYAHSQGVVHRDIKPANIIVTSQGRTKITDFGIAKLALTQLTLPGESPGTPSYMSPEQVVGNPVDGRSDLFSLGIILYWILAGEKPFTGENSSAVTFKIAYKDPAPPSRLNPSLGTRFDYVVERALAKNPTQRYQSGKEFAEDLEDLRQGRTPSSQRNSSAPTRGEDTDQTVLRKPVESIPLHGADRYPLPPPQPHKFVATGLKISDWAHNLFRRRLRPFLAGRLRWITLGGLVIVTAAIVFFVFSSFRSPEPVKVAKSTGPTRNSRLVDPARSGKTAGFTRSEKPAETTPPGKPVEQPRTTQLNIRCLHRFRTGMLMVWVDNVLTYEGRLTGTVKRQLVFLKKAQGSFLNSHAIAAGIHVIRVQVVSGPAGFNQTREVEGEWETGETKTLQINFGPPGDDLNLELR